MILAAGTSTRMGRSKALLPWFGTTLVQYQINSLHAAGIDFLIVVTGYRSEEVNSAIADSDVLVVENRDYCHGKTTSIKAGLSMIPKSSGALVLIAVDQPRPTWLIRKVIESHRRASALITSPRYRGHGGHPLLFNSTLIPELHDISESTHGLRSVMQRHAQEINWVDVNSRVVRLDLNTQTAYQSALRTFRESQDQQDRHQGMTD